MIGKVKLTREQADEIAEIQDIAYAIDIHSFNKRPDKAIAELSTADLARALLIGYEVEEEYKGVIKGMYPAESFTSFGGGEE